MDNPILEMDQATAINETAKLKDMGEEGKELAIDVLLNHSSNFVRLKATEVLENFIDGEVREALLKASNDEDPYVRGFVAKLLSYYPDEEVEARLRELKDDPHGFVADFASKSLQSMEFKLKILKLQKKAQQGG